MIMTTDRDDLPEYVSHKKVRAFKINGIDPMTNGGARLFGPIDESDIPLMAEVNAGYVRKHDPKLGGYFVLYEDGYQSWSPKEAFESGYTLVST